VRRGKKAKDRNQKSRRWEGIRKEERGRRCAVIGLRLEAEGLNTLLFSLKPPTSNLYPLIPEPLNLILKNT